MCTSNLLRNNIVYGSNRHLAYISVIINMTCYVGTIRIYLCFFSGAFAVTKIAYQLCHVCPSSCIRSAPTRLICVKFNAGHLSISNFVCCDFMGVKVCRIKGSVLALIRCGVIWYDMMLQKRCGSKRCVCVGGGGNSRLEKLHSEALNDLYFLPNTSKM